MKLMKTRLKDVAARAGVAVNTASTILNRRPNSWASKQTEERVFQAAADLGYRPNRAARGLRSGRYHTIALLVPDLHNPFYTAFADLLEVEAEKAGYELLIESWRTDLANERRCLEEMGERQVDGLAAFLSDHEGYRAFLAEQFERRRPFVALSVAGGEPLPVDAVLSDFTLGLREAVETLFALGHRRFAFLCALAEGQEDGSRTELFARLLAEKGIPQDGFAFLRCGHSIEAAHAAAAGLFQRPSAQRPTALIALNDLSAIAAMRAAIEAGLRIPDDLSIVGVDDVPLGRYLPVTLSTVGQPIESMARKTAALLLARIDDAASAPREQAVFPTRFIRRESVGPAREANR